MSNLILKNDAKEISKLKAGCNVAFTKLFKKYANKVYQVSRQFTMDHDESEEIVQELFLKIWQNRKNLDESKSFNAYILTITKSIVIKKYRKKVRQHTYQSYALHHLPHSSNHTEEHVLFTDLKSLSKSVVEELPYQQRQIYQMKVNDNLTIDQIASELKLSKRTVENHFYRARKSIKTKLVNP